MKRNYLKERIISKEKIRGKSESELLKLSIPLAVSDLSKGEHGKKVPCDELMGYTKQVFLSLCLLQLEGEGHLSVDGAGNCCLIAP